LENGILVAIALFVLAGGGIVVVDAFVIRKIRRLGPPKDEAPIDRRIDR
jgi:hypothetical protein